MLGVVMAGNDVGVLEFVADLLAHGLEAHREGIEAPLALLGEQTHDEAGIESPREQYTDVHIRHETALDGQAQGS